MWRAGVIAVACACKVGATYHCTIDDQCALPGRTTACLGGYCAADDTTCASGQRYDDSAGPLAGHCYAAPDAGFADAPIDAAMWACGIEPPPPPSTVTYMATQNGQDLTITLSATTFGGATLVTATPGEKLTFKTNFSIVDCVCPTCIDQIEIGFVPGTREDCIYDANPQSNNDCTNVTTGSPFRSINVPTTPGVYDLRFRLGQDFSCNGHVGWWNNTPPDPAQTVAIVCVH